METTTRPLPASLRHTQPSDVRIHVMRIQAEALSRLKDYDGAKVRQDELELRWGECAGDARSISFVDPSLVKKINSL